MNEASFQSSSGDGPQPQKTVARNISPTQPPITAEGQRELRFAGWGGLLRWIDSNERPWQRLGDESAYFCYPLSATLAFVAASEDAIIQLFCERAKPVQELDAEGRSITVRVRDVPLSAAKEPIYPTFFISAHRFLKEYRPAGGWMSETEWCKLQEELAAIGAHEAALDEQEEAHRRQEEAKIKQAAAAKLNPSGELGAAIAAGVAQALAELGLTPEKRGAA